MVFPVGTIEATSVTLGFSLPERLYAAVDDFETALTMRHFFCVSWVGVCDTAKFLLVD